MEITANGAKCYIDENNITGASYHSFSKDSHEVQVSAGNGFFNIKVKDKNEAENIISSMIDIIKKPEEDNYIKGFKEGLEYALKLKGQ